MPSAHTPAPLLSAASVPDPANIHQLGALLAPAHLLLSLVVLRIVYGSSFSWLAAALLTTLLATRPIVLGTRAADRRSLMGVIGSMYGLGYLNTLLSALGVFRGETDPGLWLTVILVALPVALFFTLPFMLLDLPIVGFVQGLDGPTRFDSRDELMRMVGIHALAVGAVIMVILWVFSSIYSADAVDLVGAALLAAGGLGLMVRSSVRMQRRDDFVTRVMRGEVPGYGVEALGDALAPPALSGEAEQRCTAQPIALFAFERWHEQGAYRTGRQRIALARV